QRLEGIYTAGASYPDSELFALIEEIAMQTDVSQESLIAAFGEYMFERLAERFPMFIERAPNLRDFLLSVDQDIHATEVKKLFSETTLPQFTYGDLPDGGLLMRYTSDRHLCILAEGLIRGAAIHYGASIDIIHDVCYHNGDDYCDIEVRFCS
ncbi:MAG: heme NO-binding domain-containing protein, partial [Pontibacterium sp.]